MKILPTSNYQTQNHPKKHVNFGVKRINIDGLNKLESEIKNRSVSSLINQLEKKFTEVKEVSESLLRSVKGENGQEELFTTFVEFSTTINAKTDSEAISEIESLIQKAGNLAEPKSKELLIENNTMLSNLNQQIAVKNTEETLARTEEKGHIREEKFKLLGQRNALVTQINDGMK